MMSWRRFGRTAAWRPVDTSPPVDRLTADALASRLNAGAQEPLGRSLAVLHVDAGSCGGCEVELRALRRAVYDLPRFGIRFVDSPRHADVLLVTGAAAHNLRDAMEQAHAAMPDPKLVVALGDCAVDGGVFKGSYAVAGGVGTTLPVDLLISGCPPTPERIMAGLRALLEANARKGRNVSSRSA